MRCPAKLFILAYFWSFCWYMGKQGAVAGSSSAVVVPGMCSSNCIWLLNFSTEHILMAWINCWNRCFNEFTCKLLSTSELMGSRLICLIYGLVNTLFQLIPVMQIDRSFVTASIIVDKIIISTHWSVLMLVIEQNTGCMLQQNCVISWILLNGRLCYYSYVHLSFYLELFETVALTA